MGRAIAAISHVTLPRLAQLDGVVIQFFSRLIQEIAHPYRPERHYMRGPGPAWHAKNGGLHGAPR
ncbi:MAG: hypothetical protein JO245_11845 [Pseudolabrys sp.]|nr:hypothetical protein [Pseudolabrys sp.]